MKNPSANKTAHRERYPRGKDAFDRELTAVQELNAADSLFAASPTEEAAAGQAKAEAALKAARAAYLAAIHADERDLKLSRCP